MGFLRRQEEALALQLLRRHYQKQGLPEPALELLVDQAARIVTQAHAVARERGRNVLGIARELIEEMRNRSP